MKSAFTPLLNAEKDDGREKKKERKRRRRKGGGRGRAGSCWARAASDLLRRDHRTPDVATALPASLPPRPPRVTSSLPHVVRVLRVLPLPPSPRHLLEKSSSRVATTASMKSHPPRVSSFLLSNLFFFLSHSVPFAPSLFLLSLFYPSLRIRKTRCYVPADIHSIGSRTDLCL